jgi:hypothetical protein
MDPCMFIANPGWDPRDPGTCPGGTKPGDADCDGLPDVCDPAPAVKNDDQDGDGYNNQQDICPLVADGPAPGQNQIDSDGLVENDDRGPKPDSIGNACDDSDNDGKENGSTVAPGTQDTGNCTNGLDDDGDTLPDMLDPQCLVWTDKGEITAGRTQAQIYGTNPGTGLYFHAMPWAPVCIGDTDTDLDGYCDVLEYFLGSNPAVAGSKPEDQVIDAAISGGATPAGNVQPALTAPQSCSDGVDNDLDGLTDLADPGCSAIPANTASFDADLDGVATANPCAGIVAGPEFPAQPNRTVIRAQPFAAPPGPASDLCLVYNSKANYPKPPNAFDWWSGLNSASVVCVPAAPAPIAQIAGTLPNGDQGIFIDWGAAVIAQNTKCTVTFKTDATPQPLPAPFGDSCKTYWSLMGAPIWVDNCSAVWNSEQTNTDAALNAAGAQLPTGTAIPADATGDVCDTDDDNDGYSDVIEMYMGTDPLDNCPNGAAPRTDAWALDQNQDLFATMADVNKYAGKLGRKVSGDGTIPAPLSWALARQDLNKDNFVTMADVNKFAGWLGKKCA